MSEQELPPGSRTQPAVADGQWQRVHPLTPAIRSWQIVVVIVFFVVQDIVGAGGPGPFPPLGELTSVGARTWAIGGAVAVLALGIGLGLATLSWRMTRYRITREVLEVQRGVLFRQHRRAQLDRIQAVDVVQPLLARIAGLARLNVEVAGGGNSNLELSFLSEPLAQRLRNQLLAGAAGLDYESEEAPQAPEQHWLEVPLGRLVASTLLSSATVFLVVFGAASFVLSIVAGGFALAGMLPAVIGAAGVVWNRLTRGFAFRVATSADGLRLRHGLLEQRSQTVPPGRVQAVRLSQPLLWRLAGWWRMQVNVAGYGSGGDNSKGDVETTLFPVGTRDEVVAVLWFVFPDLGLDADEHPGAVVDAAMTGSGPTHGFATSPPAARRLDWFSWRRNGFRLTRTALLIRQGALERILMLVPHARTQSLGVSQGPLERRLGLASFDLHSTPGPVTPQVRHLATETAARLLTEQADWARRARAAAGPERWMQVRRPQPPPVPPLTPPPLPG